MKVSITHIHWHRTWRDVHAQYSPQLAIPSILSGKEAQRGLIAQHTGKGANSNGAQGGASTPLSGSGETPKEENTSHANALSSSAHPAWLCSRAATDWNTGHRRLFTHDASSSLSYSPHIGPVRLADDSVIYSQEMGSIEFVPIGSGRELCPVVFHDVLYVLKLISNLLSLFYLSVSKGYELHIVGRDIAFKRAGELLFTASIVDGNIGYLNGCTSSFRVHNARLSSTLPLDLSLWHRRFSRTNYDAVKHMHTLKLVDGLTISSSSTPDPICEPCLSGKQRRHNVPKTATRRSHPLDLIHSDLKGPLPPTRNGYRYWVTFIHGADVSRRFSS